MMPRVSVCICTFRRPTLLAALLDALARQEGVEPQVVVVDNDPAGSAAPVLEQARARYGSRLVTAWEPVPNIAVARNRGVALANGDWLAFIDDDEMPVSDWLVRLLACQEATAADAVLGPVVPRFAEGAPAWIRRGRFHERPRHPTGTRLPADQGRMGNTLIRGALLRDRPGPFNPDFGRTGGEDALLFREVASVGAVLAWCDEAIVHEEVPPSRATAGWLLARAHHQAQTFIRIRVHGLAPGRRRVVLAVWGLRAVAQLVVALVLAVVCLPLGWTASFRWFRTALAQTGKLTGILGGQRRIYGDGGSSGSTAAKQASPP